MKTISAILAALCTAARAEVTEWTLSETMSASYDSASQTLSVSGTGDMPHWKSDGDVPWAAVRPKMTHIALSEGVTCIGNRAFYGCPGVSEITLPNSVTNVGTESFAYCHGLREVTVPPNVRNIHMLSFRSCNGLAKVAVDPGNETYASADGLLLNKALTELLHCPCGKTGQLSVPDAVTNIGYYACAECRLLTSVRLPAGVRGISVHAFDDCPSVASFEVAPGNPAYSSEDGILYNADGTAIVRFPPARDGTFAIPQGVLEIVNNTFYGCSRLTAVIIPEGVGKIGVESFRGCISLTEIRFPDSTSQIADYAFWGCSGITSITIPRNVERIGKETFVSCSGLHRAILWGCNPQIGDDAFKGCAKDFRLVRIPFLTRSEAEEAEAVTTVAAGGHEMSVDEYNIERELLGLPPTRVAASVVLAPADAAGIEVRNDKATVEVTVEMSKTLEEPDWRPVGSTTVELNLPNVGTGFIRLMTKGN